MARVLFVDDEPHVTSALKRALRHEPYEVLIANSADEALRLLVESPVDIVVADERMPGMPGSEFLTQVRRLYPDTIRMMLTGHATLESAIRAINGGEVYHFFTKPCRDAELALTLRHALQHRDLLVRARQLTQAVRTQAEELERLERTYPGITLVKRDAEGNILMDEPKAADTR